MNKVAFVFPGQGSQTIGMGKSFFESDPIFRKQLEAAIDILGYSLTQLILEGPEETLRLTEHTQPAIFAISALICDRLDREGVVIDAVAGHSLGEYSALFAAKAFSFEQGLKIVQQRGLFMNAAVPEGQGAMAAILGLNLDKIVAVLQDCDGVELANINSPDQVVISGTKLGITAAMEKLKSAGAKRVIALNVSGPFHSSLMKSASQRFAAFLSEIPFHQLTVPLIANVTANYVDASHDVKSLLVQQLFSPVRWVETIERLLANGITTFVEVGPGKVLTGLIRRINNQAICVNIDSVDSMNTYLKTAKVAA